MSRWLRVDVDFVDHPKITALADVLGVSEADAGWIVLRTWTWTSRFCPTGHIELSHGTSLELSARWSGARGELLRALVATRWLETVVDGDKLVGWRVHDWMDHQGSVAAKAAKERERKRAYRARLAAQTAADCPADVRGTVDGTSAGRPGLRDETIRNVTSIKDGANVTAPKPKRPRTTSGAATHPGWAQLIASLVAASPGYAFGGRDAKALSSCLTLAKGDTAEVEQRWKRALAHRGWPTVRSVTELERTWNHWTSDAPQRAGDVDEKYWSNLQETREVVL